MARRDRLVEALALLRSDSAGDLPHSVDIGELFIAELKTRRKRLKSWIRVVNAAARMPAPSRASTRRNGRGSAPK